MRIAVVQPSYIPWKGYFHLIQQADSFVFLDTVQYDKQGWRNRNQIKTPNGPAWLTIPVNAHGTYAGLTIRDVKVHAKGWSNRHLQKLRLYYRKAPCFQEEFKWIEPFLREADDRFNKISDIDCFLTKVIAEHIGIRETAFLKASDLPVKSSNPSERLVKIVQALGGTRYLSGPSAKAYLDTECFKAAGIAVEWMHYDYPEYPQLYPPFTHNVSILDLLFMTGSAHCAEHIWPLRYNKKVMS